MNKTLIVVLAVIAGFGVLTVLALMDVGYWGIIEPHFESLGAAQVFWDLVILAVMACIWMVKDGVERGIPVWPFIAITAAAGSFGPLLYLAVRELRADRTVQEPRSQGAVGALR